MRTALSRAIRITVRTPNLYPEVAGVVTRVDATEGRNIAKGDVLMVLEDSVQRATTEQLHAQAEAARAVLEELRAEPRPETLRVAAGGATANVNSRPSSTNEDAGTRSISDP